MSLFQQHEVEAEVLNQYQQVVLSQQEIEELEEEEYARFLAGYVLHDC